MHAKFEVTVDRVELKRAVAWTRRGKAGTQDKTYLLIEDHAFTVVAPGATTQIKSVGSWDGEVAVAALALKRLVAALPAEKETKLSYYGGWLMLGDKTKISATDAFMDQALPSSPDGQPIL